MSKPKRKNTNEILPETKDPAPATPGRKYVGAKYIGRDGLQYQWGALTNGQIYDIITEEVALKNSNIFEAIYSK